MRTRSQASPCSDRCTHAPAIPGRCGAHNKARTKLCPSYPIRGRTRCRFHGGRSTGPRAALERIRALRELPLSPEERARVDAFLSQSSGALERLARALVVLDRIAATPARDTGPVVLQEKRAAELDAHRARRALSEVIGRAPHGKDLAGGPAR